MRLSWSTADGYRWQIDSDKPEILGAWLQERLEFEGGDRSVEMPPPRLEIWPSGDYNARNWPLHDIVMTADVVRKLIDGLKEIS